MKGWVAPKLDAEMDVFARSLWNIYVREGHFPPDLPIIEPVWLRNTTDTIENLRKEYLLAANIKARDEFTEDIHIVVKQ